MYVRVYMHAYRHVCVHVYVCMYVRVYVLRAKCVHIHARLRALARDFTRAHPPGPHGPGEPQSRQTKQPKKLQAMHHNNIDFAFVFGP